jgi:quercetin dioxygenase-like cupin family protein
MRVSCISVSGWRPTIPFVDTGRLKVTERLPGWHGRYLHTANTTFAHHDFKRGASIHEHFHPREEVYEVIEEELELTIDGGTEVAHADLVAIVPSNALPRDALDSLGAW